MERELALLFSRAVTLIIWIYIGRRIPYVGMHHAGLYLGVRRPARGRARTWASALEIDRF